MGIDSGSIFILQMLDKVSLCLDTARQALNKTLYQ